MSNMNTVAKKLAEVLDAKDKRKPTPYDTQASVVRVTDDTLWVKIPGGISETPIRKTINARAGDDIMVRIADGRAWATGNVTAPPTDDRVANIAHSVAETANVTASQAQETADIADVTATGAKRTAEAILVYDHSYELLDTDSDDELDTARFTAFLYKGGVDVKTSYDPELFTWYLKTEEGQIYKGYGYQKDFSIAECGYGAEVVGYFSQTDDSEALSTDGSNFTSADNDILTVRATGDSVRVRDLTVSTTIFPTDKLMIIGAEDEHLVTMQTLKDYLSNAIDKQVLFNTTAAWNAQVQLQSKADTLYIYTDHQTDSQGNLIAGIKVGDGNAYLIDLPFTDAVIMEHISDNVRHITDEERAFWNNKISCYLVGTDQLIFTTS